MTDSFTETTHRSWFSRVLGSFVGVLVGLLLVLAMIVLLFWNEGRAVQTARSLAEGASAVISVGSDAVDPANVGRLVHASGNVLTGETPRDPVFGVAAPGIRLVRTVEMYQWQEEQSSETRTKLGGGEETVTTYSYVRGWADTQQNSGSFKQPSGHENPQMRWQSEAFQIGTATMGAWRLDAQTFDRLGGEQRVALDAGQARAIADAFGRAARIDANRIFVGNDPASPQVGDHRIGFEIVPLGQISVIARQQGDGFAEYQTQAGDALFMVDRGEVSAEQMFADAVAANTLLTWILRGVGLALLALGFAMVLGPMGVIADVVPFLGSLVRMGTGLFAIVLAIVVGTAVIAFAWFWYRPLTALAVIAVGAGLVWLIVRWSRRRAAPPVPAAPA